MKSVSERLGTHQSARGVANTAFLAVARTDLGMSVFVPGSWLFPCCVPPI